MKKHLAAIIFLSPIICHAQRPFAGIYAGGAVNKTARNDRGVDFASPLMLAGRVEGGVSWRGRTEVGLQVNVQPWRFTSEATILDVNAQPLGSFTITTDRAAPAVTALVFARRTMKSGIRAALGIGYSRAIGDADTAKIRYKEIEYGPGEVGRFISYYQLPSGGGPAFSAQLGYKRALTRRVALAADVIGVYSEMQAKETTFSYAVYYNNICISATAGVQVDL